MTAQASDQASVALDIESPDHAASWDATAAELRSACPMAWSTEHGGYWIASRYKDVVRIVQDDAGFGTAKRFDPVTGDVEGGVAIPPMQIDRLVPAETDRPEWDRFRGILNPRLGPRAAESFRQKAEEFSTILIDQVIESGHMDSVQDFSNPLTAMVTLAVLGFPLEEWRTFADPLHALTSLAKSDPAYPDALDAAAKMDARIQEEIARRRSRSQDDLIGHLVTAEIDGAPLKDAEIHRMIVNVLAGGVDTTTSLMSNTLIHLWRFPEHRRQLLQDRSLIPTAREELIRFFSPLHGSARTATASTCIAGRSISPGDRIFVFLASANRDEEVFQSASEVQLDRYPNRHIGFGAGIHRCVGSFLARVMFDSMLAEMLNRIPHYEVDISKAKPYPSISPINGWVNIPISFPSGIRSGLAEPSWLNSAVRPAI